MRRGNAPLPLRLYGAAADLMGPVAYARVRRKLAAHGTDPARWRERMGHATLPRPEGRHKHPAIQSHFPVHPVSEVSTTTYLKL